MPIESALTSDAVRVVLAVSRLAGAFLFVPIPGARFGGILAKTMLAACLGVALQRTIPPQSPLPKSVAGLLGLSITELAIGLTIGFTVGLFAEAVTGAVQYIAFQAGFSYATTIDPSSEADGGILLVLSNLFAGLLFFSFGLDLFTLRAFSASLSQLPPGQFWVTGLDPSALMRCFTVSMETAARLALPIIVTLIAIDLSLAALGRVQSQMQFLSLAFPVKLLVCFVLLAGTAGVLVHGARRVIDSTMAVLQRAGLS